MADVPNLYVHFPFCRRKCSYCALHSRGGVPREMRESYVARLVRTLETDEAFAQTQDLKTVYLGGGSPALCDLEPFLKALRPHVATDCEVTVELHPLDVSDELLATLRDGGVTRISMGVQSLDEATLSDMRRGYTVHDAARAFARVKRFFDNAGIDLIAGYPLPSSDRTLLARFACLKDWGLKHCSVYSLILEEKSILAHRLRESHDSEAAVFHVPSDDEVLDAIREMSARLAEMGLVRYEISNYAAPGCACRHNLAVWRGEDYYGLGDGAHGRLGLLRTRNWWGTSSSATAESATELETVSDDFDEKERAFFRLRTCEGLDASRHPEWVPILDRHLSEGLLRPGDQAHVYCLTDRGTEVCDSILSDLVSFT